MKWMALLPTLLLTACFSTNNDLLESPQVTVVPAPKNIIEPVSDNTSIDVTTTTIAYI